MTEPPNFEVGSVWTRLLAGVVDWLVTLAWGVGLATVVAVFFALQDPPSSFGSNFVLRLIFPGLPITWVVVLWKQVAMGFEISSTGTTFGHRSFGLRMLRVEGARIGRRRSLSRQLLGSPLLFAYFAPMTLAIPLAVSLFLMGGLSPSHPLVDLGDALVRNWLIWGLGVAAVLAIANHVWMALDDQGRGWHDTIAGTVVVRARNFRTNPAPSP